MHYFDPSRNFWGGHGIVGGQVPLGAGLAYGLKYKGLKGAAMAFMGDVAVNQGAVHEAYNLAALWDLPVVFVIENNRYSMGTSLERSSSGPGLAERAEGYGMVWGKCFGHDVYELRATMDHFLKRAREESLPAVVEIDTYRYRGHSVADPDKTYRDKTEVEEYRNTKDPITLFRQVLFNEGVLTEELDAEIDAFHEYMANLNKAKDREEFAKRRNQQLKEFSLLEIKRVISLASVQLGELAKERGYVWVMDKSGLSAGDVPVILYTKEKHPDITNEMLRRMDAAFSGEKAED
jgi:pyruvate dehydrogenase E1 component alpha subunit